jgi:hypothetical protein
MTALLWIQDSALGFWLRESEWALFSALIVHTLGMAFLLGGSGMSALRSMGALATIPLERLARFQPLLHVCLWAAIISGVLLVVSYPAKALTNPLFYAKLVLLLVAWRGTRSLIAGTSSKPMAVAYVGAWIAVMALGRLLAYTNTMLLVY